MARVGKEMAQDVMCEELLEGGVRGLGRRQGWHIGEGIFLFCVDDKKQTDNSYCSAFFFFSTDPSFPMGKKERKRRERGGMAGEKENGRDVTVTEKCE